MYLIIIIIIIIVNGKPFNNMGCGLFFKTNLFGRYVSSRES